MVFDCSGFLAYSPTGSNYPGVGFAVIGYHEPGGFQVIKMKYRGFMLEIDEKNCLTEPLGVRVYAVNGRPIGDTEGIKAAKEWVDTLLVLPERLADLDDFVEMEIKANRSVDPGELYDGAERGHFELSRHLTKSGKPEVWWADDDASFPA